MRRFAVALAFVVSVAAVTAGSAGSRTSKSAFEVFVEPTTTAASSGLTLETELEGAFNLADKTASASGPYSVMAATTRGDNGTCTLTRLVAFQSCGCAQPATPHGPLP